MVIVPTEQRPFQFKLRSLLMLTAIVAAFFGLVASVRNHLPKDRRGPVDDRAEWPTSLNEFLADASAAGIDAEPVRVNVSRANFFDNNYFWQMHSSPELLALMANRWPMTPANADSIALFWSDMPVNWARQNTSASRRYAALRGVMSDNLIVMTDGSTDTVYVWYWFHF